MFVTGDIEIHVQCTDTICLISAQDIANAMATAFSPTFDKAVANAIRDTAGNYSKDISMWHTIPIGTDAKLQADLEGGWWILPAIGGSLTPGILISPQGTVYSDYNNVETKPPYTPTFSPPVAELNAPTHDIEVFLTEYIFETALWAAGTDRLFDRIITNSEVPADSPVHLTTSDDFFSQAVPGLSKYPKMDLRVQTGLISVSKSLIDAKGLHIPGTNLTVIFSIINGTTIIPGWTMNIEVGFDLSLTPKAVRNSIVVNTTVENVTPVILAVSSSVGAINNDAFVQLFQLVFGAAPSPSFAIPLPKGTVASAPSITSQVGYIVVAAEFTYV